MDSEFNGWNEGLNNDEYGWDANASGWGVLPDGIQEGWSAFGTNHTYTDSDPLADPDAVDPFGTEWHFYAHEGKAKWSGRDCVGDGCPNASDGYARARRFAAHLAAVDAYGRPVNFTNGSRAAAEAPAGWGEPPGRPADALVDGLGEPLLGPERLHPDFREAERRRPYPVPRYAGSVDGGYQAWRWPAFNASGAPDESESAAGDDGWLLEDDPYASYRWCRDRENGTADECLRRLEDWREEYEWRPRDCMEDSDAPAAAGPPLTPDPAAARGVGGSAASAAGRRGPAGERVRRNTTGCGYELVSARLEREYGWDVARGLAPAVNNPPLPTLHPPAR